MCVCVRGHVCRRVRTCARVSEAGVYRRVCGCARAGPRVQACAHVCACVSEAGACGAGAWGAGPGFPLRTSIRATAAHRGLGEESLTRPAELGGTRPRCGGSRSACVDTVFLEDVSLIRYSKTPHV